MSLSNSVLRPHSGKLGHKPTVGRAWVQYAALPFTIIDGVLQIALVTSRGSGRWIIPKGWPEKKTAPYELAAREAYEEAGLLGVITPTPFGSFLLNKRTTSGKLIACQVDVFLLRVQKELKKWPEKEQRLKCWLTPAEAAKIVIEPGLSELLLRLN